MKHLKFIEKLNDTVDIPPRFQSVLYYIFFVREMFGNRFLFFSSADYVWSSAHEDAGHFLFKACYWLTSISYVSVQTHFMWVLLWDKVDEYICCFS